MQDKEISHFIEQESFINYCTNRNDDDVRYWREWLSAHPENAQQVEALRQLVLIMGQDTRTREMKQDFAALQSRIALIKERKTPVRRLWQRIAAAAAILIFLGAGTYLVWPNKPVQPIAAIKPGTFKNEILPGNKAILTLSNGKQLMVAGINAGQIVNTNAKKGADGAITYEKSDAMPDEYNTLTVPNGGGKHELKLADGTLAVVDAGSSIRFPVAFNGTTRRVSITGQVYFEVVHNEKQPFSVIVDGHTIEDIGTHFNVNSFRGVTRTTLLEGSIRIANTVLKPGQQAVQLNSGQMKIAENIDTEAVLAWKNGLFDFNHTDLQAAMQEISRWYDVDVDYQGPDRPYHFGGSMDRNRKLTSTLKILQLNGVKFSLDGRKVTVYR